MWSSTLIEIAVCVTVLLISILIGLIAGSRWLAVWVTGKLFRRELTKKRK
jgi:uncharacterized protein YneF (UPF0154 family)